MNNGKLIPQGYKQTEVGVIPKDWEVVCLQYLSAFQTGIAKGPKRLQDPIEIAYLRVANVQDGYLDLAEIKKIWVSQSDMERYRLLDEDVLLTEGGDYDKLGRGTIWRNQLPLCVHQNHIFVVRVHRSLLSPDFLAFLTSSPYGKKYFLSCSKQSTNLATINLTQLKNFPVVLPPLSEQRVIATVLSDVDELIRALEQLIAKKRDIKQAAMQQLLTGKQRLPGFSGKWEVKRLGEIATFFSGGTPPTSIASYYGGDIPWITSGDLNKGVINEVEGRITAQGLANSSAKMIAANTLLIALYGATSGVTAISKIKAAINQAVLAIVPRCDDTVFLYFKLIYLKDWLINTYTQGGQPNLSGDIVKSIEITLPPLPEQRAIATVLSDMDAEIAALEQRLDKTRALKQGMMQNLLTGRIRLIG